MLFRSSYEKTISVGSINWETALVYEEWFKKEKVPTVFSNLSYSLILKNLFSEKVQIESDFLVLQFWGMVSLLGLDDFRRILDIVWSLEKNFRKPSELFSACEKVYYDRNLLAVPTSMFKELVFNGN